MTSETFKTYFDSYFDAIRNYVYYRSSDAELATDIAQDVFLKVWEKRQKINFDNIKGLLYKMANDQFISHLRKQKVNAEYLSTISLEFKTNNSDEIYNYTDLKQKYETTLNQLPEKQKTVFLMNRMEGLTYKEIAVRLAISEKAVEKRMSQTLSTLKKTILISCFLFGVFSLGSCKKTCSQVEQAADPNCICTADYTPVCGCNNVTYSNACNAECRGITDYTNGACN